MRLNIGRLGTFYEMAREGAGMAADRFAAMTGVDSRVSVTRLDLTSPAAISREISRDARDGAVRVELAGGVTGEVLMLFDRAEARAVAERMVRDLPEPDGELADSAVAEVCQVMNSGFIDGWADVLRTEIDMSPPEYLAAPTADDGSELLSAAAVDAGDDDRHAFLFRNRIEAIDIDAGLELEHYFLPEPDAARELFGGDDGPGTDGATGIEYGKLAGFDRMAERGASEATASLSAMTGIETAVDIRRVNFVSLDAIPDEVPREETVSVAFNFDGLPSGYLLFLYDEPSARELVRATVGSDELDGMGRDAIQELSNVMASGLLDGWANMLDTTIDHSAPAYSRDVGAATVDPLVVGLSADQEFAFVFDTRIEATDATVDFDVYIIPDEDDLERALSALDTDRVEGAETRADVAVGELSNGEPERFADVSAGGVE